MDSHTKSYLRDLALSTTITIAGSGSMPEIRGFCKGAEGVHFTLAGGTGLCHPKMPVLGWGSSITGTGAVRPSGRTPVYF